MSHQLMLISPAVIVDINSLVHKTPREVEKILGKPIDRIAKPLQGWDGKLTLKSGERVPAKVGVYRDGLIEITFQNGFFGNSIG